MGSSTWCNTSTNITMSQLPDSAGILLPSNHSTGICVIFRISTSMPVSVRSGRRSSRERAIRPSPQPTSRTLAPSGSRFARRWTSLLDSTSNHIRAMYSSNDVHRRRIPKILAKKLDMIVWNPRLNSVMPGITQRIVRA